MFQGGTLFITNHTFHCESAIGQSAKFFLNNEVQQMVVCEWSYSKHETGHLSLNIQPSARLVELLAFPAICG